MDIQELAAVQDGLTDDLESTIRAFKEANPDVSIAGIYIDLWGEDAPKVTSNVSAVIDGARVSRATDTQTV